MYIVGFQKTWYILILSNFKKVEQLIIRCGGLQRSFFGNSLVEFWENAWRTKFVRFRGLCKTISLLGSSKISLPWNVLHSEKLCCTPRKCVGEEYHRVLGRWLKYAKLSGFEKILFTKLLPFQMPLKYFKHVKT